VILLAVAGGASLFGILGAYLAVPVTAVVFAIVAAVGEESAATEDAEPVVAAGVASHAQD
jgi:predicted PurR-regulated permease PerM